MSDKFINLSQGLAAIKSWVLNKIASIANPNENVEFNANGQLDIGGRLGQMSNTTGVYNPKSISPESVGNGSFLLTEGSGVYLGSKSLAVVTGSNINLKSAAAAGSTQYIVSNTFLNRIFAASAIGAAAAVDEASASEKFVHITSVTIKGKSFIPDSSENDSENDIIITTDESLNPDKSISALRLYLKCSGFSNLAVGQAVGGAGGASVLVGQRVYAASGNACALIGADIYNAGNGNGIFGRQHISRKNRWFMAGTGHDNTSGKSESGAVFGQFSLISSDTAFAIGGGTSSTDRSNIFEIKTNGDIYINGVKKEL